LLEPRPKITGAVKLHDVAIEEAMAYAKPHSKDFATGRLAGSNTFETYLPGDEMFLNSIVAKGDLTMQPVTLRTVRVGEMVNELGRQLPVLKFSPVKVEPMRGTIQMQYELHNKVVQFDAFDCQDVDGNQLKVTGKVGLPNLQGDLSGEFFWAEPQVKGCLLEGNSDAQGRMIIPVAIRGDLMHPGFSTLSDLVVKLGGRALECEKKKFLDRVKQGDTKQLGDALKKQLQGLFGQ
jgi:hypothetical protein